MSNIERAWFEASLDWHEELGFALVQALEDEDDAMTAIQVVRKFCVPAPAYRGAVADERTRWVRLILQADELQDPAGALAALVNMARVEHDRPAGAVDDPGACHDPS